MMLILVLAFILLGCSQVPPPAPPVPPTPPPSPAPTQPCVRGLPSPQDKFQPIEGSPVLSGYVNSAVVTVMGTNRSHFRFADDGSVVKLLTSDGRIARNEEPGAEEARQWFYSKVQERLCEMGFYSGAFGTDQIVLSLDLVRYEGYHLVNHGGGDIHYSPPRFETLFKVEE